MSESAISALPPRIIGKCLASDRIIIDTVVSKYCNHTPVRDYFSTILPGLADLPSGAFQTLLPVCGSPGIHRLKRPGY
jgi:hypothetical protein